MLQEAQGYFVDGKPLESLRLLDHLAKTKATPILCLRALVRESANDLTGALLDLQGRNLDPHLRIDEARILAKLGFSDRSIATLGRVLGNCSHRNYRKLAIKAVGIGGRRFDLYLMGFDLNQKKTSHNPESGDVGAILEHLNALGEYDHCGDLRKFAERGGREISLPFHELKSIDRLRRILDVGPSATVVESCIFGIRGWLSTDEARLLSAIASDIPDHLEVVEIGSFFGRSTIALACGIHNGDNPRIHAVDPHKGLAGIYSGSSLVPFLKNIETRGARKKVRVHLSRSSDCARRWRERNVGLLFIDALHDYDSVKNDFEVWFSHLADEGYIVFHDVNQCGPNAVVRELLHFPGLQPLGLRDSTFVFQLSHDRSRFAECPRLTSRWDKYLESLQHHYSFWLESEQSKLRDETLQLFEMIRSERSCEPNIAEKARAEVHLEI